MNICYRRYNSIQKPLSSFNIDFISNYKLYLTKTKTPQLWFEPCEINLIPWVFRPFKNCTKCLSNRGICIGNEFSRHGLRPSLFSGPTSIDGKRAGAVGYQYIRFCPHKTQIWLKIVKRLIPNTWNYLEKEYCIPEKKHFRTDIDRSHLEPLYFTGQMGRKGVISSHATLYSRTERKRAMQIAVRSTAPDWRHLFI